MLALVNLLSVKEAAENLGVTIGRVHQLITDKRLPAQKLGSQFVVKKEDLELVRERKTGRPRKNTQE